MDQPPTLSQMPLTIEVPYVYQSELSGIGQTEAHDVVWYGKTFRLPDCFDERTHLIFGAVDWHCDLFVNGRYAGSQTDQGSGQGGNHYPAQPGKKSA